MSRWPRFIAGVAVIALVVCTGVPAPAEQIVAPDFLWDRGIADKSDPVAIADTHLKIPYREDGALDNRGHFTTFARPDAVLDTPGLNCSGLVLSVCRFLFNKNWSLEEATRDRQRNSGSQASLGKDWDFGWDLILNLTDGRNPRVLMPDGGDYPLEKHNGETLRGFDLSDANAWGAVFRRMQPGKVYLGSISKPTNRPGYRLLHYHVVMIVPDQEGGIWLYHATQRSQAHRININSRDGMRRFMSQFTGRRGDEKRILLVEATLPEIGAKPDTAGATGGGLPGAADRSLVRETGLNPQPLAGTGLPSGPGAPVPDGESDPSAPSSQVPVSQGPAPGPGGPDLVINHLAGKVLKAFPEVVTHIPAFSDASRAGLRFWFQNAGRQPKAVKIALRTPGGNCRYEGSIPADAVNFEVHYPRDFGQPGATLKTGEYLAEMSLDGTPWLADVFEVSLAREAQPKIVAFNAPSTVRAGQTFTVTIRAENRGAESDYGGITLSCPDPSGLRLVAAKSGKIYGPGSTVLAVTTDRIKTRVPMAERWIELWGESKVYDLEVQVKAGRPGKFPLYVRCALRGVNVKSSVVLMDPVTSDGTDQQGFPVYVHQITVQ